MRTIEDRFVFIEGEEPPPRSAKQMAYGNAGLGDSQPRSPVYRLERGFPFQRRGRLVAATPQFKALALYGNAGVSAVAKTVSQSAFSNSQAAPTQTRNAAISIPVRNKIVYP